MNDFLMFFIPGLNAMNANISRQCHRLRNLCCVKIATRVDVFRASNMGMNDLHTILIFFLQQCIDDDVPEIHLLVRVSL